MPRKYSPADLNNAVSLYASGKTFAQVSAQTGISPGTIHGAVKNSGIEPSRPYRTPTAKLNQAVKLYLGGKNATEIRAACGVSSSVLSRELRKRNIKARSNRANLPTAEIASAYRGGESELSLSKRYGIARGAIRRVLIETSTPVRSASEAQVNRLAKMSEQDRIELTRAAHEAARQRTVPAEELFRRARQREQTLSHASQREFDFGRHLRPTGDLTVIPQKAVGTYNVDFAVGTVAVEILGGNWHAYKTEHAKRTPYILNAGWHILFVWEVKRAALCVEAAEYVMAWAEEASRDPSGVRQYRVIRGDGKLVAKGSANDKHFPLIPPSVANFSGRPID